MECFRQYLHEKIDKASADELRLLVIITSRMIK